MRAEHFRIKVQRSPTSCCILIESSPTQFCSFNKLTSVFNASVLLLMINLCHNIVKVAVEIMNYE